MKFFEEREPIIVKPPATIAKQIDKLKNRGLIIDDENHAYTTLEIINYYRLVHYFAVFLDDSGQYIEGTCFEDGVRLYEFDRKLRAEILVELEEIEVAARAAVSNYHVAKYGALGYLNSESFDRRHNHKALMNKAGRIIAKNSDLSFVRHHNKKYGGAFPLWVMMEMFSFGTLAAFYRDLSLNDKKEIAGRYFKHDFRNVENWLENLAVLRNRCAHYNRIYGNPLPGTLRGIEIVKPREYEMKSALFDHMLAVKFLHRRNDNWERSFIDVMEKLFRDYDDIVSPQVLGFPEDWAEFFK